MFEDLEKARLGTTRPLSAALDALRWDRDGLLPTIAQDVDTREVLMLAWMNRAALEETLVTARVCYWSRSRKELWRKGKTSGHVQQLVELHLDCDGDALLLQVRQTGPACHTNRPSCFYLKVDGTHVIVVAEPSATDL